MISETIGASCSYGLFCTRLAKDGSEYRILIGLGQPPFKSLRRKATAPMIAATAPIPIITALAVQFGAEAGAGAIW